MVNLANFGETYTDNIRIHVSNYTVSEIEGPVASLACVTGKITSKILEYVFEMRENGFDSFFQLSFRKIYWIFGFKYPKN